MYSHYPVMLKEAVDGLDIKPNGIYIDGTMGGGGHSSEIAAKLTGGRLIAIDKDDYAHSRAKEKLAPYSDVVTYVKDDFRNVGDILRELNIEKIDGFLLDLGVSSFQLDDTDRGFSYMRDAPLDMRMNRETGITAAEVVATYTEERLVDILFKYGEEKFARRIAAAIIKKREQSPILTTGELAKVIDSAVPTVAKREGGHPAKRTFQAIRIEVNGELDAIAGAIEDACSAMNEGGRISIITFHSLEDRIVKETFARLVKGCICPPKLPICVCGIKPALKLVSRKPILPSEIELEENSRSKSAKLRVAQRV